MALATGWSRLPWRPRNDEQKQKQNANDHHHTDLTASEIDELSAMGDWACTQGMSDDQFF